MLETSVDANATTWFFEKETTAIAGAGPYVFSVKRREIADIKLEELTLQVEVLVTQLTALAGGGGGAVASDGGYNMSDVLDTLQKEVDALYDEVSDLADQLDSVAASSGVVAPTEQNTNAAAASGIDGVFFTEKDETQIKAALVLSSFSFVFWMIWIAFYVFKCVTGS